MSKRPLRLRYYGDPVLRTPAQPVEELSPALADAAKQMLAIMEEHNGCGLAGNQAGLLTRIFVMQRFEFDENRRYRLAGTQVVLNPELSAPSSDQVVDTEGCLSIPGLQGDVARPHAITMRFMDLEGVHHEERLEGLEARIAMHEVDHLDGILYVDHLNKKQQKKVHPVLEELKERYAATWSE